MDATTRTCSSLRVDPVVSVSPGAPWRPPRRGANERAPPQEPSRRLWSWLHPGGERPAVLGEIARDRAELERAEDGPLRLAREQEPEARNHQLGATPAPATEALPVCVAHRDLVPRPRPVVIANLHLEPIVRDLQHVDRR